MSSNPLLRGQLIRNIFPDYVQNSPSDSFLKKKKKNSSQSLIILCGRLSPHQACKWLHFICDDTDTQEYWHSVDAQKMWVTYSLHIPFIDPAQFSVVRMVIPNFLGKNTPEKKLPWNVERAVTGGMVPSQADAQGQVALFNQSLYWQNISGWRKVPLAVHYSFLLSMGQVHKWTSGRKGNQYTFSHFKKQDLFSRWPMPSSFKTISTIMNNNLKTHIVHPVYRH